MTRPEAIQALQRAIDCLETRMNPGVTEAAEDALYILKQDLTWQPINTAPRDGTQFLGHDGASYMINYWSNKESYMGGVKGWVEMDDSGYECRRSPTHWMPLPDPPENNVTG